jgi:hypothetical protein
VAAKTEFEQWIANEYSFVHPNMVAILKPCWEAATKAAEARFTSTNKQSAPCSHQFVYREYIGQTPGRCICGAIVP